MLKMQIIGNLGKDAEVKQTQAGQTIINFSVAHTTKRNGQDATVWVDVSKFVEQGQTTAIAQYLKKGTKVYVEGMPSANGWTGQDGTVNGSLRLTAYQIELLGQAQAQPQAQAPVQPYNTAPAPAPAYPQYQQPSAPQAQLQAQPGGFGANTQPNDWQAPF
jgi:single-strand DNA-binding protein